MPAKPKNLNLTNDEYKIVLSLSRPINTKLLHIVKEQPAEIAREVVRKVKVRATGILKDGVKLRPVTARNKEIGAAVAAATRAKGSKLTRAEQRQVFSNAAKGVKTEVTTTPKLKIKDETKKKSQKPPTILIRK